MNPTLADTQPNTQIRSRGVRFVSGRDGRPNGEAYVELAHEDDLDAALEKNKASLGSRYVEVRFRLHRLGLVWGLCNMM